MSWKKTGPVQHVCALLCQDMDITPVLQHLQSSPKAFQDIEFAQGENWQVVFGAVYNSEEILLPHIAGATPLYKASPNILMRIGTAFNLPPRAQKDYIDKIRADHGLTKPEIVLVPQFLNEAIETNIAVIFTIEQKVPVSHLSSLGVT